MINALLMGSVIPAFCAGILTLVAGFLPALLGKPLRRAALPLGFALGFYFLNSIPAWPPSGSANALFYVSLLCFIWSFVEATAGRYARILRWAFFAVVAFMILKPLLLEDRLTGDIPGVSGKVEMAVHMLIVLALARVGWWAFDRGAITGLGLLLVPILVMAGLSLLMLFSASALLAQLAGTVCAVHAAALVLSFLSPRFFRFEDHQVFSVVMIFGFSLIGFYFQEVNLTSLALVLSPLLLFVLWPYLPLKPVSAIGQLIYLAVLSLIPIAIGLYPAYVAYSSSFYY